jgi:hypothetical protein
MPHPTCFVLMPFGEKPDGQGHTIDFDKVYRDLIQPAVKAAELDPIRADRELTGGIIHKAMFERLILCPFAVADLTLANANVFYELGVRHAIRPFSTVSIFAEGTRLPFDVTMLRTAPYGWNPDGTLRDLSEAKKRLIDALETAKKEGRDDSPVFQLVELPWRKQIAQLDHQKTDTFREQFRYSEDRKQQLAAARKAGLQAIKNVEQEIKAALGSLQNEEVGVVVDLYLSYRAVKAWGEMVRLAGEMSRPVAETVMVQEQLALALNREAGECQKRGDAVQCRTLRDRSVKVLQDLIKSHGNSSETNGILGRVYKDSWEEARNAGEKVAARGLLLKATDAYLQGFEADWRDAYPGVNAVTLMELQDPRDERQKLLLPVVDYSNERKIASKQPDYWDYATRLELAVLAKDQPRAEAALADAVATQREVWEAETTARNLRLIREAREQRGEPVDWLVPIIEELTKRASS